MEEGGLGAPDSSGDGLRRPVLRTVPRCFLTSEPPTPDFENPPIPQYKPRTLNEPFEQKQARLVYQSRKRGMLENGLLLSTFASKFLKKLTPDQLDLYDNLINKPTNDWEIYHWVTGKTETPVEYDTEVMNMLKEHAKNEEKEERFVQPDLYAKY
ncbi:hypothetical protein CAPTEDRAFT_201349 [Capitella teleta]|uniref:Succinate dehydrogenase assembly factor 2, mitochondrial n=1 Tax=Capitella teleta TaxID=283909 RepID=R7UPL4_CAPTE|nr:hypothetical protein CAPTEDRAFT_201349 [Capitella teleta]|eukprot:ELU05366.1 hypothetical protein CAPTEDRAFT_201349 [Capitella teleta]